MGKGSEERRQRKEKRVRKQVERKTITMYIGSLSSPRAHLYFLLGGHWVDYFQSLQWSEGNTRRCTRGCSSYCRFPSKHLCPLQPLLDT